jgi:hypothetical protein
MRFENKVTLATGTGMRLKEKDEHVALGDPAKLGGQGDAAGGPFVDALTRRKAVEDPFLVLRLGATEEVAQGDEDRAHETESTTEAFNILLPLLGGIVTDNGGLLSHAAIVSREYGIRWRAASPSPTAFDP